MDDSTLITRKDAANRDMQYDVQTLVNHQISERKCTLVSAGVYLARRRILWHHLPRSESSKVLTVYAHLLYQITQEEI